MRHPSSSVLVRWLKQSLLRYQTRGHAILLTVQHAHLTNYEINLCSLIGVAAFRECRVPGGRRRVPGWGWWRVPLRSLVVSVGRAIAGGSCNDCISPGIGRPLSDTRPEGQTTVAVTENHPISRNTATVTANHPISRNTVTVTANHLISRNTAAVTANHPISRNTATVTANHPISRNTATVTARVVLDS